MVINNKKIRFAIYVGFTLGGFVVAYLAGDSIFGKNIIGEAELKLYSQIASFAFVLAAVNTGSK